MSASSVLPDVETVGTLFADEESEENTVDVLHLKRVEEVLRLPTRCTVVPTHDSPLLTLYSY